jgi:H+/gluconate symporter-like permease
MFSALFRIFSWLILAGGMIIAIVDATRSVASNALQLTSLGETLETYAPSIAIWLEAKRAVWETTSASTRPLVNVIDFVNAIPVALLAAVLFVIIYALASRNREKRHF